MRGTSIMVMVAGYPTQQVAKMPTALLTELTHEAADSSRRVARYVKAFIASLEAEGLGLDRRLIELTIRESVANALRRGVNANRHWESLFELLRNRPGPGSLVKLIVELCVELADEWLGLEAETSKLVDLGIRAGLSLDERAIRELDDAARGVAKMKTEAAMILGGLDRPRPEIDVTRLAEGRKDAAEGRTMTSDQVIAAIRAARK